MKRFRWLSGHLVSLAIASGGPACRHPSPEPPGEAKVACEPMGPEGYEYVRAAPPPSAEAWGKFDAAAVDMAKLVYERAHGDPATWDDPTDGFLWVAGITCVPKEWRTSVWVKRGGFERIEAAGFRVHYGSGVDDSGSVTLSPSRLFDFAAHPDVVRLGDSAGIGATHYELDKSGAYIGADPLRAAHPNATGAGTVVALIDSGIDWTHGTFLRADGTTKILTIWDRGLAAGPGETAGRGGIGVVYTANDINFSLGAAHDVSVSPPPVRVRHRDVAGDGGEEHGTLVAGIAAGNGRPVKCCGSHNAYVGIAPEASLVVVGGGDFRYDGTDLKDVLDFIAGRPEVAGLPVVVNMSAGTTFGPHDGTSPMEQAVDEFVRGAVGGPTRAFVKAAGNDAQKHWHVQAPIGPGAHVDVPLVAWRGRVAAGPSVLPLTTDVVLQFWLPDGANLRMELLIDGVAVGHDNQPALVPGAPVIAQQFVAAPPTAPAAQAIARWKLWGLNRKVDAGLVVRGYDNAHDWTVRLHNRGPDPITVDGWMDRNKFVRFRKPGEPGGGVVSTADATVSTPGCARSAITVANHTRKWCCNLFGEVRVDPTSSRGPALDPGVAGTVDLESQILALTAMLRGLAPSVSLAALACDSLALVVPDFEDAAQRLVEAVDEFTRSPSAGAPGLPENVIFSALQTPGDAQHLGTLSGAAHSAAQLALTDKILTVVDALAGAVQFRVVDALFAITGAAGRPAAIVLGERATNDILAAMNDAAQAVSDAAQAITQALPTRLAGGVALQLRVIFNGTGQAASGGEALQAAVRESIDTPSSTSAKPTLAAPGAGVTSADAYARKNAVLNWLCCDTWAEASSGTSFSAPHVTGVVALMLQKNPRLPIAEVQRILRESTRGGDRGDPNGWGAGELDARLVWENTPPPSLLFARTISHDAAHSASGELAAAPPAVAVAVRQAVIASFRTRTRSRAPNPGSAASVHPLDLLALVARVPDQGAVMAALVTRHFSEVRRLIWNNRRVAAMWHRAGGPDAVRRLLAHGGKDARLSLNHLEFAYACRWLGLLRRFGSGHLQGAIDQHGVALLGLLAKQVDADGGAIDVAAA